MLPFDPEIFPTREGVFIVGGSVRDILLGTTPLDYDIAVAGDARVFASALASACNGRLVALGQKDKAVFRVVKDTYTFDIVPLFGATLATDLERRDFTINAMAYNLATGEIIDPFNARSDLADRQIRLVSDRAFKEDPLRLLRAYRIGALLDFEIEPATRRTAQRDAHLITASAAERIQSELIKLVGTPHSHTYLSQMTEDRLLDAMIPEFSDLRGCVQNEYHQFNVLEHTLTAYEHLENLLNEPEAHLPQTGSQVRSHLDSDKAAYLKCALLLHDIGKPASKTVDRLGRIHFYGHGQKSADQALRICQRLKFSRRAIKYIEFIIRNHLRPLFLFVASQKQDLKRKGMVRFFRKCGQLAPDLLLHTMADIMGKSRTSTQRDADFIHFAEALLHVFFKEYEPQASLPPLITGHDLNRKLGLRPSPLFKLILKRVEEARLTGRIQTKHEALALAQRISYRSNASRNPPD